ncbi:T9SS type A sorting domain-containing protein [Pontibacter sp. G13]|uniref:T9SS type A sorting domain-containing protein n=1 Tax=Pontibacter sp. G13 TaxID=3074898 RepID=UPI002889D56E|nr:T9SS type A sorting domain-containing protein [Pontibacter sp. G13]WNJ19522.1 T9SS type A sorting domain-containing protein [Pontibacter sp. G13]
MKTNLLNLNLGSSMMATLRSGLLLSTILFSFVLSRATHVQGVDVSVDHVSGCDWKLTQRAYFDCTGAFATLGGTVDVEKMRTLTLKSSQGCTLIDTLTNPTQISVTDITQLAPGLNSACDGGVFPGYAEVVFEWDFTYCPQSSGSCYFEIEYETCCLHMGVTTFIVNSTSPVYNSSEIHNVDNPSANGWPVQNGVGSVLHHYSGVYQYDMSMTDPDGDSLVYTMIPVSEKENGVIQNVAYLPGYSVVEPLGSGFDVQLNPQTGWLTISPKINPQAVHGVIRVQAEEYRNGVLQGRYNRDLHVKVFDDFENVQPIYSQFSSSTVIETTELNFELEAGVSNVWDMVFTDADAGDSLELVTDLTQMLPGAMVTVSGSNPLTVQIDWTPDTSMTEETIMVPFKIRDNAMPLFSGADFFMNLEILEMTSISVDPRTFGNVQVAPNPFQDATQITFENTEMEEVSLILRDLQGREVKVIPAQRTDRFTLNREGLAPGLYLFELKGKESYVGKVVIE